MNESADLQSVDAADEQFRVLALRYLADELDNAGADRFEQLLATSDDRCEEFSALAMQARLIAAQLSSQLESEAAIRGSQTTAAFADATRPVRTPVLGFLGRVSAPLSRPVFWSIAGVGILFVGYVVAITWNMLGRERSGPLTATSDPKSEIRNPKSEIDSVATITGSEGAIWAEGSDSRPVNTRPWPGAKWDDPQSEITSSESLLLASGLVELKLKQGTTLVVEGPAEWSIDGDNAATLKRGKLVAKVPQQAIGFALETPTARIVDLGTEFGVEATAAGDTSVHVLKGLVQFQTVGGPAPPSELKAGEAVRIPNSGTVVKIASEPDQFVTGLPAKPASEIDNPDTGLVAYYPFDGDTRDHAAAYGANSGSTADDLQINDSSEFLEGKVGRGLRLMGGYGSARHSADLRLPATFTIEAWVVAERLTNDHQRLVLNWGDGEKAYHFGLFGKRVELFVRQKDATEVSLGGGELKIERWEHVAATADGKLLRVYLNGVEVGSAPYDGTLFVNATEGLGLGDGSGSQLPAARFVGALDELAIWNVALSPDQIAAHARGGTRGYRLTPGANADKTTAAENKTKQNN